MTSLKGWRKGAEEIKSQGREQEREMGEGLRRQEGESSDMKSEHALTCKNGGAWWSRQRALSVVGAARDVSKQSLKLKASIARRLLPDPFIFIGEARLPFSSFHRHFIGDICEDLVDWNASPFRVICARHFQLGGRTRRALIQTNTPYVHKLTHTQMNIFAFILPLTDISWRTAKLANRQLVNGNIWTRLVTWVCHGRWWVDDAGNN